MPVYIIYYHLVWATKYRKPFITPPIEDLIRQVIADKSRTLKSQIHAINMVEDHIHIAATIPPAISVADWVKNVKAVSSYEVNKSFPKVDNVFRWQQGYSVHSFGLKALSDVVGYIANQKQRHAVNDLLTSLEYIPDE